MTSKVTFASEMKNLAIDFQVFLNHREIISQAIRTISMPGRGKVKPISVVLAVVQVIENIHHGLVAGVPLAILDQIFRL